VINASWINQVKGSQPVESRLINQQVEPASQGDQSGGTNQPRKIESNLSK
jgi:hypothetical protein